jgi:tetratricopeptide (TPR) repeat protein
MQGTRSVVLVAAALVAVTLALFAPTYTSAFVNYDDPIYVSQNPHVQAGLTWSGITWAFQTTRLGAWHPLTWLSLQLDASLYGTKSAGGFHLTNVLLHAAAAVLLFLAMRRLTGTLWRAALVAALFAVHPLHVESVAWVAERKDVLSGLFWMLTLLAYARYAERPTLGRSLAVVAAFALGLMAKPMLVTLPCVLLLLDYWPLRRPLTWRLLLEKLPLFALTAVACPLTLYAQQGAGAMIQLTEVSLANRAGHALISYCAYLLKAVWPANLAVFYPYPAHTVVWQVVAAGLLLAAVTAVAVRLRRRCPYVLVGWLWFLGTLVPVIGLVQVGGQAWADRYTYLPYVGLLVAVTWVGADLLARWPTRAAVLAGVAPAVFASVSLPQVLVWHDSVTMWQHTRRVTAGACGGDNDSPARWLSLRGRAVIENNLGVALTERGDYSLAEQHYAEAARLDPKYMDAHYNLARALTIAEKYEKAAPHWEEALRLSPEYVQAHLGYAYLLEHTGQTPRAARHYRLAAKLLTRQGKADRAAEYEQRADLVVTLVENPWFRHWSRFRTGTTVTSKFTVTASIASARCEGTTTTRLVEKGPDRVLIEVVSVVQKAGGAPRQNPSRTEEIVRMVQLPPGAKKEDFGKQPEGTVDHGTTTLTIGSQEHRTTWYRTTTPRTQTAPAVDSKIWMSEDVPGKVVRAELRLANPASTFQTVELLAVTTPD